jgi:3-phenylpropionate/trans-cinnamate dioxygenase ferredoxin subunit
VTSDVPGDYALTREGEILRCPWHGWEFDLHDGRSVVDPEGTRVRSYQVEVELRAEVYPVEVQERALVLLM